LKIGRLPAKGWGTIRAGSRIGLIGFYVAILGVFLSLGILGAVPHNVKAATGQQFNGLWYTAVVDFYASPANGGTVTRPNGCAYGVQSPTSPGGNYYFTGTRLPTMAVGYATAPMNFWATAVPNPGWVFLGWSNGDGDWYDGNRVHVQYDEGRLDSLNGWEQIVAMFSEETVTIDFRAGTGIVYDVNSGMRQLEPNGIIPLECHVSPAYDSLYEFGGWIGDFDTMMRVNDETASNTYIDMDLYEWTSGGPYWIQPTIRTKTATTYLLEWSTDGPGCSVAADNATLRVGEKYQTFWETDIAEQYAFLRWDLSNVGCSDVYSDIAYFWLLTGAPGTAVALTTDTEVTSEIVTVTIAKTGQGTTVPSIGVHNQLVGRLFDIRAIPASGYRFSQWNNLPNGLLSANPSERISITENTTITAIFVLADSGGGGGGGVAAQGIWGGIMDSIGSVGLGNAMGRMFVVLAGMVAAGVVAGKNKYMRVAAPLGVLGVGIVGLWVPIWIVILLAIGLGIGLLGMFGKRTGAS
jgi:hypothetical protein